MPVLTHIVCDICGARASEPIEIATSDPYYLTAVPLRPEEHILKLRGWLFLTAVVVEPVLPPQLDETRDAIDGMRGAAFDYGSLFLRAMAMPFNAHLTVCPACQEAGRRDGSVLEKVAGQLHAAVDRRKQAVVEEARTRPSADLSLVTGDEPEGDER